MQNTIKLQTDSVLQVPLQKYFKDFVFIVNSEKFETSSFVADLLSPIISSRHLVDPTLNEFTIKASTHGDFNKIINLINFQQQEIDTNDISFITEVIDQLGTEKVDIHLNSEEEITNDNIFDHIKKHQSCPKFYKSQLEQEIEYFTSHFNELKEKLIENIRGENFDLADTILESIISNSKLVLDTEEDLLEVVNELYLRDKKYSRLYEFVEFKNVETDGIKKFISVFDVNDISTATWLSICDRLEQKVLKDDVKSSREHHENQSKKCFIEIADKPNEFDGILNYLQTHSNIKNEIDITYSSYKYHTDTFKLLQYNDTSSSSYFETTSNDPDSWVCFEFKNHQIIPSSYIIRSYNSKDNWHLKSWNIEGSNDKSNWTILDEQRNNSVLNGANRVNLFTISNKNNLQSFKFIRIHLTGPNWYNNNGLMMNSIEFYGKLI